MPHNGPYVPVLVRSGLWESPDGRVSIQRRDDADVARREWVLKVDGGVIDNGINGHIDFPTLREAMEAAADEVLPSSSPAAARSRSYRSDGDHMNVWHDRALDACFRSIEEAYDVTAAGSKTDPDPAP